MLFAAIAHGQHEQDSGARSTIYGVPAGESQLT